MSEEQLYVDYFRRRILPILLDDAGTPASGAGSSAITFTATGVGAKTAAAVGTAAITFSALGRQYSNVVSIAGRTVPAYTYNNLVETATALSSSTEDAAYPLMNLYNRVKAHPFKFTTTGGYIEVDLGFNQPFNVVAIIGHDATTLTGTVKAGASPNPSTTIANVVYRAEDLWVNAETNARYVRITLTGDITTIGELVIAEAVPFPRQARWGIIPGDQATGITHRTYGGVTWDSEHYDYQILRLTYRYPQSEYETVRLFSSRVRRNPFVYIPDISQSTVFYVKKSRSYLPQPVGPGLDASGSNPFGSTGDRSQWYDWSLDMEAESVGLMVLT